jgi:calcium-dependent protein kinase
MDLHPHYTIFSQIGSGGNSLVYLAQQSLSGQYVALKAIPKSPNIKSIESLSFFPETEILKTLDHPNIIKCFENFESNEKFFITLEYLDGGSLFSYLRSFSSPLPLEQVSLIMSSVLKALRYCHQQGVIHRDVKLENLFLQLNPNLSVKLGDFGSAVWSQQRGKYVGTLTYLAPEVFTGDYDEKVDIWACGIVLYVLITGHSPYNESDPKKIRKMIKNAELGLEKLCLSKDLQDLLEKMLCPQPKLRISAAEALKHPWLSSGIKKKNIQTKIIEKVLKNPKLNDLQNAVSLFINSMLNWNQEMDEENNCFELIDLDSNGKIDAFEFYKVSEKMFGIKQAKKITKSFFERFDLNRNGFIEYSEFINALSRSSKVLKDENLEKVFRIISCEGKEKVFLKDVEEFFGIKMGRNDFVNGLVSVNEFKMIVHLKNDILCL